MIVKFDGSFAALMQNADPWMCICQNPKSKSRHSDHAASRSHHDSAAYGETSKYFQLRKYFLHFANDFAVKFSLALIDSRPVSDSSFLTTDRDCRTFLNYELCVLNENLHFFPFFPAWVITMVILMESSEVLSKGTEEVFTFVLCLFIWTTTHNASHYGILYFVSCN